MRDTFLVFGQPLIEEPEMDEVLDCLRSAWLGTGPKTALFERRFAEYKQVPYAVAVNSCTAALHLSCTALGLGPGDEVITSPMTFCATVNAVIHSGATPVLADIDPTSFNLAPSSVEARITPRTRAILPVHFAGRSCDMDALMTIADRHGIPVIEDCAHAIETEYHGRKAGTIGAFGCFSFYSTKNVVTGEGGMVLCKREADANRIKVLALHGMSSDAWKRFGDSGFKHYNVVAAGFKYNMMDLQAAIGIHQLARVEKNRARREQIWNYYNDAFRNLPVSVPAPVEPDTRHAYHLYTILIDQAAAHVTRDGFVDAMTRERIGVGVHYRSLPEHPFYQQAYGWDPADYPNACRVGRQTVSLPLSAKLSDGDVESVVTAVRDSIARASRAAA